MPVAIFKTNIMLQQIIRNEWRLWRRDRRTVWLLATLVVLSLLSLLFQVGETVSKFHKRKAAQEASRSAWLDQGEKHPHIAAHFGNYAYKQPSVLMIFDPGLTAYTGSSVYLEPHRQNDFLLYESGEQDTGARFGSFTPAFVCQFIVPLLIILLTFTLVVSEKAGGTYSLYLVQGASPRQIITGKTAAVALLFGGFITLYLLLTVTVGAIAVSAHLPLKSFLLLWLGYLLYYIIWCGIGVTVSALVKTSGAAVSLLLLFWIFSSVILPKWAASAGENAYPLITNYAFKKKIAEDIANGLNGHDVASERARRIQDSVLQAEGVDSVQRLKFNLEGYIMQRGEEYSSNVYDIHYKALYNTLENQRKLHSSFSLISPAMLLRNISMAASNASLETEMRFQQDAEDYRRSFVQAMNYDMMYNSIWGSESWEHYKVKNSLYRDIKAFEAPTQSLKWRMSFVKTEIAGLLAWLLLVISTIFFISRKNQL
ncbi:MAG: hypothetical protein DI535_07010 [Citrobacter freundii]|nr:MAG: hypothetical protein DI535_07010 [Citrobacter freundii]